jgi:ubiquinone/menaquinone biosynthesis C-methylase UbiE
MPSIDWNLETWDKAHGWDRDGDEWSNMAAHCKVPYPAWKQQLLDHFLLPYANGADVLEIAPGHGRWSETLVREARTVVLVDLSPSCIAACRERFAGRDNVSFHVNDGRSLPVADASVDFVWSFDAFVHMDPPVIDGYLQECARVLRPGGHVVIHHADKRRWSLAFVPLTARLGLPGRVAQRLLSQGRLRDSGNRSDVSREHVAEMLAGHGLQLVRQTHEWGESPKCDVSKYRDCITVATRPRKP